MSAWLPRLRERMRRWMQRAPGPEAQPITLIQSRVYVLPTRAGLAMGVTLLLMLVGAINYNLSLGYALTFLLGAVWVAHILASWRTLVGLQLQFRCEGEAFVGAPVRLAIQLGQTNLRERNGLVLRLADGATLLERDMPAATTWLAESNFVASRRGILRPGRITVETRFPLGWIRAWGYVEPDAPVLVMPCPEGDRPLPDSADGMPGEHARQSRGDEDFAGLRPLQPGDPRSRIAWKSLARSETPLVKHFAGGDNRELVLDWSALPQSLPLEAKLSQLTQWVLHARQAGLACALLLPDGHLGAGQDAAHYAACLERLALFGLPAEQTR